ncbi:MAG: right-handed parallel beta-helix repeat-containing protein [Deltaproteobacteria bacterium]
MFDNFTFTFRTILIVLFISAAVCGEALSQTVIHVDNENPSASDDNPGTSNLPIKTIAGAANLADQINKSNTPVTVLVHPGTYRESVILPFISDHSNTPAEIVLEADSAGSVIVSGSDVWTGWTKKAGTDIYTHNWTYNWGAVPNPWPSETLEKIVRRREMIFIDGNLLKQVLSIEELEEKSFYVSEDENKVYVWPPADVNINDSTVEVAVRSGLLIVNNRENVTIRGFIFQHDNTGVDGNAVEINNSSNILIEGCSFIWNNWGGLRFNGSTDITARRNIANHNGGRGIEAWRIKNLLFEENTTSFNNWRGVRGNFTGFAVAGMKHLRIHDAVYRKHISLGNMTRGFWCDFDCENVVIEDSILADNLKDGIFIEANQGPFTIRNTAICNNKNGPGVLAANAENVELEGNVLYGNGDTQIALRGVTSSRAVSNWETGEEMHLRSKNWTMSNNVILGSNSGQTLIDVKESPADIFIDTINSDNNIWYNAENANVFKANGTHDFNGWKSITGQDTNSVFGDPDTSNMTDKQNNLLDTCMNQTSISIFSVSVDAITHDSVEISWSTSEPADSQVEYGPTESYGSTSELDTSLAFDHKVLLTGLSPETTYHFRLISKDQRGKTYLSYDFTFTTAKFADNSPPATPTVLTAIVISSSQINLSWGSSTDNVGVSGYRIYRNGSATTTTTDTYYSDTGLKQSTKYSYTVTAYDAAGNESEHSAQASATTLVDSAKLPPEAPGNLEVKVPQP